MAHPDVPPRIVDFPAVAKVIDAIAPDEAIAAVAAAFTSFSRGEVSVPPIQTLGQPPLAPFVGHPDAQACIKSAYVNGGDVFVAKVASGGGGSNSGLVLVFSQRTFRPVAILLDNGLLTELRTAAAGALAVRLFAPARVDAVAVVGCGVQARWQLRLIAAATGCRRALLWARRPGQAAELAADDEVRRAGWRPEVATSLEEACRAAQVLVCVTCAREPLVRAEWLRGRDVLAVAVGADSEGKQELEPACLSEAALLLADSRQQCLERGELQRLPQGGHGELQELGQWLGREPRTARPAGLVVFDSTGVAAQDVAVAELALGKLQGSRL